MRESALFMRCGVKMRATVVGRLLLEIFELPIQYQYVMTERTVRVQ